MSAFEHESGYYRSQRDEDGQHRQYQQQQQQQQQHQQRHFDAEDPRQTIQDRRGPDGRYPPKGGYNVHSPPPPPMRGRERGRSPPSPA